MNSADRWEIAGTAQAKNGDMEGWGTYKLANAPRVDDVWLGVQMGHLESYRLSLQAMMQNLTI
jgi:hypothetical protein